MNDVNCPCLETILFIVDHIQTCWVIQLIMCENYVVNYTFATVIISLLIASKINFYKTMYLMQTSL